MVPASEPVSTPSGLLVLFSRDEVLTRELPARLEQLAPDLEVHVARSLEALGKHLSSVRADITVLDVAGESLVSLRAFLSQREEERGLTLVIDREDDAERRPELLAAGVVGVLSGQEVRVESVAAAVQGIVRAGDGSRLETERHYHDILEASSDGIFVLVGGVFQYANASFAAFLGDTPDGLVGQRRLIDFVAPTERAGAAEDLARVEVSSGVRELHELTLQAHGRASRFEVSLRASVVNGRRGLVGVARDVTTSRHLQEEIERARRRVAQVERLRALGELAAGVAHDFNNTVGTILGRVLVAKQKLARGESATDDLAVIELAGQNAVAVVRRIEEFARPTGTDTWQDVDLGAIIQEAAALADAGLPAGVRLEVDVKPSPRVQGNGTELREVVQNLLRNALDAVGERGHVRARCFAADGKTIVEVEDDGPGIPPAVQEHMFEPFFTTKGERGTGLGLSICNWIVRRHDAQMQVTSAPGQGTRFRLVFAPFVASPRRAARVDKQALTVLVVDDDGTVAEMLKDMLSLLGHTVLAVTDPCVAAQLLGERSVDLMITDLDLPGMTGWQLARQVRDLQPGIMVGLVTGWPLGASDHELTARGVDFVLAKPFSGDALQASIEKLRRTR